MAIISIGAAFWQKQKAATFFEGTIAKGQRAEGFYVYYWYLSLDLDFPLKPTTYDLTR